MTCKCKLITCTGLATPLSQVNSKLADYSFTYLIKEYKREQHENTMPNIFTNVSDLFSRNLLFWQNYKCLYYAYMKNKTHSLIKNNNTDYRWACIGFPLTKKLFIKETMSYLHEIVIKCTDLLIDLNPTLLQARIYIISSISDNYSHYTSVLEGHIS